MAPIMKADSGEIISEVKAPTDGIIFYAETRPVVYSNLLVFQIIREFICKKSKNFLKFCRRFLSEFMVL